MRLSGRLSLAERINRRWPDFRGERPLVALFFVAMAMLGCLVSARDDTFWHLRAGRDIVTSGRVDLVDRYFFTAAGRFWPNHEWLWQAASYLAHAAGGMPLLATLAASLVVATAALAFALAVGSIRTRLALVALAFFLGGAPWTLRPHLFTHLALVATLWAVTRRRLWLLPPLFLVWTNVHGAVVLGFPVLGAALVVAAMERDRPRLVRLGLVALACAAATLASPLGARLYTFIGESMERSRLNGVIEWRPALSPEPRTVAFWLASAGFVVLLARAWRGLTRTQDRVVVLAALLFIPLGFRAVRNIGAFAPLLAPAASRLLAASKWPETTAGGAEAANGGDTPYANARVVAGIGLAAAALVAVCWSLPLPLLNWSPMSPAAAAVVRSCPGQVYNHYNKVGRSSGSSPRSRSSSTDGKTRTPSSSCGVRRRSTPTRTRAAPCSPSTASTAQR